MDYTDLTAPPQTRHIMFHFLVGDESEELTELLRSDLLHVFTNTDRDTPDEERPDYTIRRRGNGVDARLNDLITPTFLDGLFDGEDVERYEHEFTEFDIPRLLEETSEYWSECTIAFANEHEGKGTTAVLRRPYYTDEFTLVAYFEGVEGYNGWDAKMAASDHTRIDPVFTIKGDNFEQASWPFLDGEFPEWNPPENDYVDVGLSLTNQAVDEN